MKLNFENKNTLKYITVSNNKNKYEFVCEKGKEITLNNKNIDIDVIEDKDGFTYIKYKNKKYYVDIIEKNQNKFQILINGVSYYFTIETPISFKRRKLIEKNKSKSKVAYIKAPMPGKIIDVLTEENSDVKENESLLILEAMKMQNEILSTTTGRVKKVYIKPNQTVNKDDVLVEIAL